MSAKDYPSVEFVRQCLREEDGRLFWLERPREHFPSYRASRAWNAKYAGKESGSCGESWRQKGRFQWSLKIGGSKVIYRSHIVWLFHKGEWPKLEIDHKNRNPLDDRIENLRESTHSQNLANGRFRSNNKSGYKGVCWDADHGRWRAAIGVRGRSIYLGLFDDPKLAHAAYLEASKRFFGEFAFGG